MIPSATPLQTASVLVRLICKRLMQKVMASNPEPDHDSFNTRMIGLLARVPETLFSETKYVYLAAHTPPWIDTGIELSPGATVTTLAQGRVYLNKFLDIYANPEYALWARVGETGEIINGTRDTNTFTTDNGGRLYLATLSGEWADKSGGLATAPEEYDRAKGGISVQVFVWNEDPVQALEQLAEQGDVDGLVATELDRLRNRREKPAGWEFLWFLGRSEIYSDHTSNNNSATIECKTHENVCILQKDAPFDLTPDTRLEWTWRVDQLPSDYPEYTLPTHDYMSIAVEFDNGQDLTYYWSQSLPVETCYRCPLPTWNDRETHLVIRTGKKNLGEWLNESRNVFEDCRKAYGEPPKRIVRVWLIANSLLQRKCGMCEYKSIRLTDGERTFNVSGA